MMVKSFHISCSLDKDPTLAFEIDKCLVKIPKSVTQRLLKIYILHMWVYVAN